MRSPSPGTQKAGNFPSIPLNPLRGLQGPSLQVRNPKIEQNRDEIHVICAYSKMVLIPFLNIPLVQNLAKIVKIKSACDNFRQIF
jgi:hypothetical protein